AGVELADGQKVTRDWVRRIAADELLAIRDEVGEDAFAADGWQRAFDLLLRPTSCWTEPARCGGGRTGTRTSCA
ncbi:hypothetical protein, partial [Streptomyces harbinensis]|uniref:hypothetical protein n=1 Tax=Streptomyces harbinensis TaxID=1176198 RepID=UPI0034DE6FD3